MDQIFENLSAKTKERRGRIIKYQRVSAMVLMSTSCIPQNRLAALAECWSLLFWKKLLCDCAMYTPAPTGKCQWKNCATRRLCLKNSCVLSLTMFDGTCRNVQQDNGSRLPFFRYSALTSKSSTKVSAAMRKDTMPGRSDSCQHSVMPSMQH